MRRPDGKTLGLRFRCNFRSYHGKELIYMEYYFEVYLEIMPGRPVLVKARDVVEAGKKVVAVYASEEYGFNEVFIERIVRTNIARIIE